MSGSFIKELSFIRFKNVTIMGFNDCNFLTKLPDLSSILNLKELIVEKCTSLVEVHDSVGSLDNLLKLSFHECSNLRIFPRRLKLRSLRNLNLSDCSNLHEFPEIGCEMKYLSSLNLLRSAVEELPISIRNLTGLDALIINSCKNLVLLPIFLLQNLRKLGIGGPTVEDEILLSEERLLDLQHPTNSSTALQVLNLSNCPQIESSFFPKSSFFTMFNSSATLRKLILSESEMVSLPSSIKGFVALSELYLRDCEKLEEILELPPNIKSVDATGCISLQRFSEVLRILKFDGSHIRSLHMI
ncbi:disease resistance protein Roq1-like [Carya illinoinensis]|uniref:disease resistance protein Roq1-like n=1 Tax=Carya illinoinensis TaxID=32201 RepID=UPI001C71F86E|nr:disease resistance protein Roq1-like [Carya illinoinensis]